MKKIFLVLLSVFLFGGAVYYFSSSWSGDKGPKINIGEKEFLVEIADNSAERSRGLGGRESLCQECGMLFEFARPGVHSFWMKNMQFSLDIIWILDDRVVFIAKNVPVDLKGVINPGVSADRVLEINAGLSEKYGIREGSQVKIGN
ncbi:MAG: DUF192 domain-containing protein [Candidatus Moranbacteria bacterium]|nr:DUF192 domain-containing protein [Candidatus Moranbacteria bacterium]